MSVTVWGAFDTFRKTKVDLDPDETKKARASRDFLFSQLMALNAKVAGFPPLTGSYIHYGSFARRTKIRPLNDIDMMVFIIGRQTSANQSPNDSYRYWLKIHDDKAPLAAFHDDYKYVDSIKILNKIKGSLPLISQYSKAEIKRTKQAVTLNLKSYPWAFDIVPAVEVANSTGAIDYYLIPDGIGEWIRSDPRKDSANVTAANVKHSSNLLPVLRLLKYWNNRTNNKSRLPSYYFETIVVKTFQNASAITSYQAGVKYFFDYGTFYLNSTCADPHGLGPNLDANIDAGTKQKIAAAMNGAATYAGNAITYEAHGNAKTAIYWWQQLFGPGFPSYG